MDLQVDEGKLRESGVRLLVAFGSRTSGKARPRSDLDVGVCSEPFGQSQPEDIVDAVAEAIVSPEAELDVVDLDHADPLLLFEVACHGRPLFEARDGDFEEFRILAVKRYMDTAWMRRIERDALKARYG